MLNQFLTPERQSGIYASGLLTIFTLGSLTLIGLGLAVIWLFVQGVSLVFKSCLEALSSLEAAFLSADPFIRVIVLVSFGLLIVWLVKRLQARC